MDGERDAGYWVGDGTVEGSTVRVLYNHYRRSGPNPLDLKLTGTALASFDLPGLTLRSLTPLPVADRIAWGSAILEDGDTTYIYGTRLVNDSRGDRLGQGPHRRAVAEVDPSRAGPSAPGWVTPGVWLIAW